MAGINSEVIEEYFKDRPQLKRPHKGIFGFEIQPEWKPFIEHLIKKTEAAPEE